MYIVLLPVIGYKIWGFIVNRFPFYHLWIIKHYAFLNLCLLGFISFIMNIFFTTSSTISFCDSPDNATTISETSESQSSHSIYYWILFAVITTAGAYLMLDSDLAWFLFISPAIGIISLNSSDSVTFTTIFEYPMITMTEAFNADLKSLAFDNKELYCNRILSGMVYLLNNTTEVTNVREVLQYVERVIPDNVLAKNLEELNSEYSNVHILLRKVEVTSQGDTTKIAAYVHFEAGVLTHNELLIRNSVGNSSLAESVYALYLNKALSRYA